jgi:signal transduction histidine kinase/ActR/RegA family two-component response regulator
MTGLRRVLRSRLLWRGAMIVALFVGVQTLLYGQREALIEKEASFGHAVLDNAWSISELMNETKNTTVRLAAHADGRAAREDVELAYDVLWSRIGALDFAERVEFEGLAPLVADYHAVLDRHDAVVFSPAPIPPETAVAMIGELEALSSRTRRLWSVEFNQNRQEFLGRVSGKVDGSAHEIDVLMALIALGGLAYLAIELVLSNLALRREQRLAAEARSASEMKSAFLANMSHEVRTPLGGVLGAAELLAATPLDREQRVLVQTVANSAEHLLGVVNQVLDLSKIEAGKVEIEDAIIDIRASAEVVIGMFRKAAQDKGIALSLTVHADVPPHVRGDALRLRQVLANLLSNAVKFTEAGRITMSVAVAHNAGAGRRITIIVEDTGIGIASEAMSRIFDAFSQSDVSDARRYGGTGLGLTISRRLVQLMDGDLTLESRAGEGTRAAVDLPLRPVTVFGTAEKAATAAAADVPSPLTVLIADDNATNRLLLSRMLASLVREVRQTEDGAGAVAEWRAGGVDLVLLDIQMPEMTGVEAATAIRMEERKSGRLPVPIYSISANAMPHQLEAYEVAGMNGHLSKPFRKADLAALVMRHRPQESGSLAA